MPVYRRRVNKKILAATQSPKTKAFVTRKADELVDDAKFRFLSKIEQDPSSVRVSSDDYVQGYFGFYDGDQPVSDLQAVFMSEIRLNKNPRVKKKKNSSEYTFNIKYPSVREIYSESSLSLPWISKTWVEALQRGLNNIEHFLLKPRKGRSGKGVQIQSELNNRSEPTDSEYLRRLRKEFSESLRESGL